MSLLTCRHVAATVLVAAGLLSPLPANAQAREPAGVRQALDAMVAAGAPGVLARIDDDRGTWIATSGVADLETRVPVPREARFRIASLTKSMVAAVVLQLVREGRVSLEEKIATRLPGLVEGDDRITVRHLLNHTGGLADYAQAPEFADPARFGKTYTPRQLVAVAERLPRPERGRFSYSNTGYILLGLLVEKVTGHDLGAELERRIFRPAMMTRTYLPLTRRNVRGPHATGYYLPKGADPDAPGALKPITRLNPSFAWAAYGVVSDARDVNRFYQALFGGRLVARDLLAQMRTGVGTPQAPVFPRYGLGLESAGLTCGEMWGATGAIPGYQTFAFADATGKRRMTLSVNVQRSDPKVAPMLLAGVDALNRYFCGEPYKPPTK
ncbi:class A beta-lactamase-related serine hydrolase [Nonomuraea deserti]|uniref:Class A beta-lactamase-related serine hydrolase n=1 Tax=Nonomuraea deserti TaxID=1848322 RepID=A0A4V2Y9U1_9ACTN|nr:serine hydrolase domain-containing protein [Nonomuraea deserti]TDD01196.1 class A beta-lactamase-related serine hydrolase [Nonomuraea deserti]